jgi:pimeloyl-ACP methyl ester carboxylesterase
MTTDHWIDTDRGKLFARAWTPPAPRTDSRAVILLFHDSLGCVDTWRDFPEQLALATRRVVIAYDRLGFGRSDPHQTMLPGVCAALNLDAIVPFGHSVGGAMAIAVAARWPERCEVVVTESAQSFIENRTLEGVRAAREIFEDPEQVARVVRRHGDKARWTLEAWIGTWLDPAFADWCLDEELRRVRCPSLALHGDDDEYGTPRHLERITRLVSGTARGVVLEGCGHIPHREQPGRVLEEVVRFLDSSDAIRPRD